MFLCWQYQKYPRRPKPSSSQDISNQKHKQFKYWNGLGLSFKRKHFKTYQYVGVGMAGPRLNINISKNRNMNYSKIYTKSVCWYDWAWTKENKNIFQNMLLVLGWLGLDRSRRLFIAALCSSHPYIQQCTQVTQQYSQIIHIYTVHSSYYTANGHCSQCSAFVILDALHWSIDIIIAAL